MGEKRKEGLDIDLVRVVGLETYLVYIKLVRARLVCRERDHNGGVDGVSSTAAASSAGKQI